MGAEGVTVLIAEDDQPALELLSSELRRRGYSVISATNGQAALTAMLALPITVIVTDVEMPVMTGLELLKCMREMQLSLYQPSSSLEALSNIPSKHSSWVL